MQKILVVGQTPPPYGGQGIMIETLLGGRYSNAELTHVRMSFSKEMDDMGKFRISKIWHLFQVIVKILYFRIRFNIKVLYYPPCGPDKLPMFRDLAILCTTRWLFSRTIFHFHAAGISEIYPLLPWYLKFFYRWAYCRPDVAIQLSEFNPKDGQFLEAKHLCILPYGIVDDFSMMAAGSKNIQDQCNILFVGLIKESKGILVLIEAARIIKETIPAFMVNVVGKFESPEFEEFVLNKISSEELSDYFDFKGVLTGKAKHEQYFHADIFCFPTFFESESFGLVVAEAMQFGLPVIASKWRGVQSLVLDGETGYLTPVHDSLAVAEKIRILMLDPELRFKMGAMGRRRYLKEYTIEKFYDRMQECFSMVQ